MPPPHATSDPFAERGPSRFVVGIDLGTTNSAVTFIDTAESPWRLRVFPVPQLVDAGQVEARETLPSFHYQSAEGEFSGGALKLPWSGKAPQYAVGFFARDHGTEAPARLIASAKSWLCHSGVDRTAELLPWQGAADVERLSPVEVSSRFLRHIREAWDAAHRGEPLSEQEIVLTLPASFDEIARELTVEAALIAELPRVVLIEEPQAAFYSWIDAHAGDWESRVSPGQKILVCDIGGGTSDFTLIRVKRAEGHSSGAVQFHRVAVGEHLILGGDNLDLSLARHLEQKLGGNQHRLTSRQWDVLVRASRRVKETLLGEDAPRQVTVNLPGGGAKVIGGGLHVVAEREEIRDLLLDGFFPRVRLDEKPQIRQSGFQEFGLPFAADAAITRYLADFLTTHRHAGDDRGAAVEESAHDPARPDIVLFNGGVFESAEIRSRMLEVLASWFSGGGDWRPIVLDNERLDLAVARGAAYYGMVRRGQGVRIAAGLARTYYLGAEGESPREGGAPAEPPGRQAVCLVPGSAEPGQTIELARTFDLLISAPAEFPLYVSSTRLADRPGEVLPFDPEQMKPLPAIRTVLKTQRKSERGRVQVRLVTHLTELGTLELWCRQVDSDRRWRLQFDVRSATQTDMAATAQTAAAEGILDDAAWEACEALIEATFGLSGTQQPERLVGRLADVLGAPRDAWPTPLLRRIWESLIQREEGRRRSAKHEARWLNLLGFALRPGYGMAVDDWRVAKTWRTVQGKLAHGGGNIITETFILWRRIAGGFSAGQQRALAEPLFSQVRGLHRQIVKGKGGGDGGAGLADSPEIWRLLGSLELLPVPMKIELGGLSLDLMGKKKLHRVRSALAWTLGRLGSRVPLHGPLNTVVPAAAAGKWAQRLMDGGGGEEADLLALMQLCRATGDRHRDLPSDLREQAAGRLVDGGAPPHYAQLVREGGLLDHEEQNRIFGESLPAGLRIA